MARRRTPPPGDARTGGHLRLVGGTDLVPPPELSVRGPYGLPTVLLGPGLPELLDDVALPDEARTWPSPEEEAALLTTSRAVRWARQLLDLLGQGRPTTRTGALRRGDTEEAAELLGIRTWNEPRSSMWDVLELSVVWSALVGSGAVTLAATRARPGLPVLVRGPSIDETVRRSRLFHSNVLGAFFAWQTDPGRAAAAPSTAVTLLAAAGPDGLSVPEPRRTTEPSDDWFVWLDLLALARLDVVERTGDVFRLPRALVPAVAVTAERLADPTGSPLPLGRRP
ncbi:hypothetical protein [Georgenia sp. Z1491]|uniref:hypothetical protein n=1 Tax=Georgenia sp. Z1491 TaxID=3416707 RepID=UPI003CF6B971